MLLTDEASATARARWSADLRDGDVALLENLRFFPGEEANDDGFARQLASYADVYVNDAFGTAHRAHASTAGMIKYVADKGAGLLMQKEIEFLGKLLGDVERPYLAVVGGAKVSDKIAVLENLLGRVDAFLIGGAMANTFLKAKGGDVGKSRVEEDKLALARAFLAKAELRKVEVLLPVGRGGGDGARRDRRAGGARATRCRPTSMALDIGPRGGARASPTASRARARSSGTGRWACSRRSRSPPARWPSPRRWRRARG